MMSYDDDIPLHFLSRRTDPITSDLAVAKLQETGKLGTQRVEVYKALAAHPGATSAEIAEFLNHGDRYVVARRLPDLEKLGLVERLDPRVCRVCGNLCLTWGCVDLRDAVESTNQMKQQNLF